MLGVLDEGVRRSISARKTGTLLACLLIRADRIVSSEQLMTELWGDCPPRRADAALHVYVSQLRRLLSRPGRPESPITTKAPGYMLRTGTDEVDLQEFQRLAQDGRTHAREVRADGPLRPAQGALPLGARPALNRSRVHVQHRDQEGFAAGHVRTAHRIGPRQPWNAEVNVSAGAGDEVLPGAPSGALRDRRPYAWMLVLSTIVLALDQASKVWAVAALGDGREITVIPGMISFRLLYNPGAAFSIGTDATWVFALTTACAVVGILFAGRRLGSPPWAVVLGVLLGGSLSHLFDRLFRTPGFARGHVVDFIDYHGLFVGNIADIAITGGAALFILLSVRGVPFGGPAHAGDRETTETEPTGPDTDTT